MSGDYLFTEHDLYAVIQARQKAIRDEIDGIPADRLLATAPDAWGKYLSPHVFSGRGAMIRTIM